LEEEESIEIPRDCWDKAENTASFDWPWKLTSNMRYRFSLAAANQIGYGPWSGDNGGDLKHEFQTEGSRSEPPGGVEHSLVIMEGETPNHLTVNWAEPSRCNGSAIKRYRIDRKIGSTGAWGRLSENVKREPDGGGCRHDSNLSLILNPILSLDLGRCV